MAGTAYKGACDDVAVVRYTPSGALDTGFSDDEIKTLDLGPDSRLAD